MEITQNHQVSPYLIVGSDVENKIKYLCNKIPDTEWSGVLFYKTKDTYEEGLKVICVDLYLMDIGTITYTEFNTSPSLAHYIAMNDLFEYEQALIHSHNHMATCPSGTDIATLKEEGSERIHFVSLIVNNAGTYSAFITRKCITIQNIEETAKYKTFGGVEVESKNIYTKELTKIEYSKMEIIKEDIDYSEIDSRIAEIQEEKRKQEELRKKEEIKNPFYYQKIFNYEEYKKPLINLPIDDKQVQSILRQIITGSVLSANNIKLDLYEWVPKMESIYDHRFKTLDSYNCWIDSFLEALFSEYTEGEGFYKIDEGRNLAEKLYNEISKFTPNKYIKIIKNSLLLWME